MYFPVAYKGQPVILDDYPGEVLKALEHNNGIIVEHARCWVTAVCADAVVSAMLGVSSGTPLLVQITTANEIETPVIFSMSYTNPAVIRYETLRQRLF